MISQHILHNCSAQIYIGLTPYHPTKRGGRARPSTRTHEWEHCPRQAPALLLRGGPGVQLQYATPTDVSDGS